MKSQTIQLPPRLSAAKRTGYAFQVTKERLPVILVKLIDFFHRRRNDLHKFCHFEKPDKISHDVGQIMSELVKLRKELETNKPMTPLDTTFEKRGDRDDLSHWLKVFDANRSTFGDPPRWFDSPLLFVECFLYRKIYDILSSTENLSNLDPFIEFKQKSLSLSEHQMSLISEKLKAISESQEKLTHYELELFTQISLWSNKCDLSMISMNLDEANWPDLTPDLDRSILALKENILCNDLARLWPLILGIRNTVEMNLVDAGCQKLLFIDLIASNSELELFCDMCLLHTILLCICEPPHLKGSHLIKMRIHVKKIPWFVSDATVSDVNRLLNSMATSKSESLNQLSEDWSKFLNSGLWSLHEDSFWTLPHEYAMMSCLASDLHDALRVSSLIIFKGDLNYRKLVDDRSWHESTPLAEVMKNVGLTPILAIRALKSGVLAGLDANTFERVKANQFNRDWAISGEYGLIQLFQSTK